MSDIRVMHVMSQIINFLYRPIPGRERLPIDGLDTDEIWSTAIAEVVADKRSGERSTAIRKAQAACVTALLDQELWLVPDQRAAVAEFSEAALPRKELKTVYTPHARELIMLAYPLHRSVESVVNEKLSDQQLVVWAALKDLLRINKTKTYVDIAFKNPPRNWSIPLAD